VNEAATGTASHIDWVDGWAARRRAGAASPEVVDGTILVLDDARTAGSGSAPDSASLDRIDDVTGTKESR